MKNIAPYITRQRLLVEGFFSIDIDKKKIGAFYSGILKELNLKAYGRPTIHATGAKGRKINQGYDCFIPLIDSGISLYVWSNARFFSVVIFTCKRFSAAKAIKFCDQFFLAEKIVYKNF